MMREVLTPKRGSGPVICDDLACRGHRQRCLFGRQHVWSTWYEDGKLQRTRLTFHCFDCGGVCTAEEDELNAADEKIADIAAHMARRLEQIEDRLLAKYPKAAKDGELAAMLNDLGDSITALERES